MTDCTLAAASTTTGVFTRPTRRPLPSGVPRWAWLFGVTVVPLAHEDPTAPPSWVFSASAGATHATAVLFDPDDH